jgi:hypothetical protein
MHDQQLRRWEKELRAAKRYRKKADGHNTGRGESRKQIGERRRQGPESR